MPAMNSRIRRETMPLLHDHHSHISLYAALASCHDIAELDARSALAFLRSLPGDRLSVVRGWRTNELRLGRSELASFPPILLINFSLHGYEISDAGLPYVRAKAPELAEHRHDVDWREQNVPKLFEAYCELAGLDEKELGAFMDGLRPLGIGSAEDLVVASAKAASMMRRSPEAARMAYWTGGHAYATMDDATKAGCSGFKFFLDGALGARSAAIGPWVKAGNGLLTYDDEGLSLALAEAAEKQTAVAVHAIGELAVEQALRCLARVEKDGGSFPLVRLEHVQFITEAQARLARERGYVLSMQPNFSSDSVDYADRLDAAYLAANNPFRMLIDRVGFRPGRDLIFGSDGMPHGIAYPARVSLFPAAPGQRLSLDELVAGYGPARGATGSVELEIDESRPEVRVAAVS